MQLTVAVIGGAHGLKGHVRVSVRTDDPDLRFQPGVVLDSDNPAHPVLTIADVLRTPWRLRFAEVTDRTAAEALHGTELFIETDEWESSADEWYDHQLIGLPARTPAGTDLGTVVAVEHGLQDLLVVRTADARDVRVPFVTALVPEIAASHITIDAPGGLFDDEVA